MREPFLLEISWGVVKFGHWFWRAVGCFTLVGEFLVGGAVWVKKVEGLEAGRGGWAAGWIGDWFLGCLALVGGALVGGSAWVKQVV